MKASRTTLTAMAVVTAASAVLAACSAGGGNSAGPSGTAPPGSSAGGSITVWSAENQADRIAIQQSIIDGFTKATGIQVNLVGIDDSQFNQLVESNALSGKLPDVMGALSLADVRTLEDQKLLDTTAAAAVVKNLGATTFAADALKLETDGSTQLAVPDSAWIQMLLYRKDLFNAAGLPVPNTYANIEQAAKALTTNGQYGITLATDPKDVFTEQTFEALALGNGCDLVDAGSNVAINSSACQATWNLYADLAQKYSPSGTQTVDTTRAAYYAGQAAMVDWSSYILPSLGGGDNANLPSCSQCKTDPTWLAKNTGIVTAIAGPDGKPATYGEVNAWTVTKDKNQAASEKFIEYMMSDGYLQWLSMSPAGKVPVRTGNADQPTAYTDGWKNLQNGQDTKSPLSDVLDAATLQAIENAPNSLGHWAIPEGQGALLGSIDASLVIPKIAGDLAAGSLTATQAADQAQQQVSQAKSQLK